MLTFTLWPRQLVRIGLAILLTGVLTLGLLTLSASDVAATSLVATNAPAEDGAVPESELLRVVLETTTGPMTIEYLLFIEQNVVLPDYYAGPLLHEGDADEGSSADRPLTYDEIKFLHDNWVLIIRNQSPYGVETSTNLLGLSDLELTDELRVNDLVSPSATLIDESHLWLQDEPGIQPHYGRSRAELIEVLRAQNLADFEAMEQAPGLYTE